MPLNPLDILILGLAGIFALIGFFTGFWMQLMRLGALVTAYVCAGLAGKPLGPVLARGLDLPMLLGRILATGLAFFLLYTVLSAIGWIYLKRRRKRREREEGEYGLRKDEKIFGALLGGAKSFLFLFVLLCAVVLVEKPLEKALGKKPRLLQNSHVADLARNHNILSGLHLPAVANVAALSRVSTDPAFRDRLAQDPKVQQLVQHPKIKHLAGDRALVEASRQNNIAAILSNPRLNAALEDPEIQKLLSEIDLSKIEK